MPPARRSAPTVGLGAELRRRWVLQAQVDDNQRPGVTSAEQQRIMDLEREVRDLKEANEIVRRPRLSSRGICAPRGARCIERW